MTELYIVLKNTKDDKTRGKDNIPGKVWKLLDFTDTLLPQLCYVVYFRNPIDKWRQGCLMIFPRKRDNGKTISYWVFTLRSIVAKFYNYMPLSGLRTHTDPIMGRRQNGFRQNRLTSGQILSIRRIKEGAKAKHFFNFIHRQKMREILLTYKILLETVNTIGNSKKLYTNTKFKTIPQETDDTSFFEITVCFKAIH